MLIITRKVQEAVLIGDNIEIIITDISADKIKIGIKAPKEIPIIRKELLEIKQMNVEASIKPTADSISDLKKLLT